MKYCIIYALTNFHAREKISVGLVCITSSGWSYKFSQDKINTSLLLLNPPEGEYVNTFISEFRKNHLDGRDTAAVLSALDTLHRYSNNYVIFSPIMSIDIPEAGCKITPESLFDELILGHCRPQLP